MRAQTCVPTYFFNAWTSLKCSLLEENFVQFISHFKFVSGKKHSFYNDVFLNYCFHGKNDFFFIIVIILINQRKISEWKYNYINKFWVLLMLLVCAVVPVTVSVIILMCLWNDSQFSKLFQVVHVHYVL